jgi:phasin family protein
MIKSMNAPSIVRTIVIEGEAGYTGRGFIALHNPNLEDNMQFVSSQHINLMNTMASDAIDGINRLASLNLRTAHQSVDFATESFRQLLSAREPRDFFALAHQSQEGFERFLSYGRELFTLTTGLEARTRAASVEVPQLDELVHAPPPPAVSYPGQDEYSRPDGPTADFQPPPPRDVHVRKAARNQ